MMRLQKAMCSLSFSEFQLDPARLREICDVGSPPDIRRILARLPERRQTRLFSATMPRRFVDLSRDLLLRPNVEALPHAVNFDVPHQPEDCIHREERTARAETTGHALTFVAPDGENDLAAIERAVGWRLDRRQHTAGDLRQQPCCPAEAGQTVRRISSVTDWPTIGVGPEPGRPAAHPTTVTGASRMTGYPEGKRTRMSKKLFVGGLSWNTDDTRLRETFAQHGEVTEAKVITDRDSGRSRGFGFVTFADDDAAEKAIAALNQSELDGRSIKVNVAQERDRDRDGGRGGNRRW